MSKIKKNRVYLVPIFIAAAMASGIYIGSKMRFADTPDMFFATNSGKDKLNRLIDYIDYEYVDDVNTDSIVEVTVNNILSKLDPHSVYIPSTQTEQIAESMKGEFVGVGISINMINDSLTVVRTLEDTPAEEAGILAGDRILIADKDTLFGKGYNRSYVIDKLRGEEGSPVKLELYRKSSGKKLAVTLHRAPVPIKSVDAFFMIDNSIGYIKVNRFAESTYKEFKTALSLLKQNGAKAITLDLRDNPGGYMEMAEQMADEFLTKGKLIVFTRNKKGEEDKYYATAKGEFENGEVYVLINERTASASEIVAGALQDNDKGTIIGRRSFGKGLVQKEMPLPDGSAVRLTVSRYYTPTGRSIQRSYENGIKDYYDDFNDRYSNGEMQFADSIKVSDSLKFKTPKGKIVYGGGGIIPDVFVPLDFSYRSENLSNLLHSTTLSDFVFDLLDNNRTYYASLKENDFVSNYFVDDSMVNNLQNFIKEQGYNFSLLGYETEVKQYIKAHMAQQLFGENAYYRIVKQDDAMLQKVKELYYTPKQEN